MTEDERLDLAFEFYETPAVFTRWLLHELEARGVGVCGRLMEPCVGLGAITSAVQEWRPTVEIWTNDLDLRRPAACHKPAERPETWASWPRFDAVVTNPPFGLALPIAAQAIAHADTVAIHVRGTIHEPLKTPGLGRSFLREHPPNLCLWLPRFPYRRSRTTGKWATDSVACCWLVWLEHFKMRETVYAPDWVIDVARAEHAMRR